MMRALVIDDSRAIRLILRRLLVDLGFTVDEAADGVDALEAFARSGPPELALVDWNMPRMDGLQFIRAVRADEANNDVVLLMVSTECDVNRMIEALAAGANEYAMKPFTREVIAEKLALVGMYPPAGRAER
jgi:two-component system, chemotaxis family, chemotaxis protein CheY